MYFRMLKSSCFDLLFVFWNLKHSTMLLIYWWKNGFRQFNDFHPSLKPSNPSTFKKSSPHYKSFLCKRGHKSTTWFIVFPSMNKWMVVYRIRFDPMSIHEIPHFGMGHKKINHKRAWKWKSQRLELFMCIYIIYGVGGDGSLLAI